MERATGGIANADTQRPVTGGGTWPLMVVAGHLGIPMELQWLLHHVGSRQLAVHAYWRGQARLKEVRR